MNKQESILSFWRDIEVFTLPDFPADAMLIDPSRPLPWEMSFEPAANYIWRHTVYFGKQSKEKIISAIEKLVGRDSGEADWVEKPNGFTCMAVLIVDQDGHTSHEGGYLQASYVHGLKCLADGLLVSSVNEMLAVSQQQFKDRYPVNQYAESLDELDSPVLQREHLENEILVLNSLDAAGLVCGSEIYVKSARVSKVSKPDPTFLNSFYLDDLHLLLSNNQMGSGILAYLSDGIAEHSKKNVLSHADTFFELLDPVRLSAGKWPSDPKHGLYAAQFAVVNSCLDGLWKNSGITGVNGPPGTGKTTLLQDVIAAIVTDRAKLLIKQGTSDLFGKGERIEKRDGYGYYFMPKSKVFQDTGIVVASNNNSAVENISKELPDEKKISRKDFPEADYFCASSSDLIEGDSWGLIAAALGNAQNKQAFKNNFWYGNTQQRQGFANLLYEVYGGQDKIDQTPTYEAKFENSIKELAVLLDEFKAFQEQAEDFHRLLKVYLRDVSQKAKLENKILLTEKELAELSLQKQSLLSESQRLTSLTDSIRHNIVLHQQAKPLFFFLHKLLSTRAFHNWNAPLLKLLAELTSITSRQTNNENNLSRVLETIGQQQGFLLDYKQQLVAIEVRATRYLSQKESIKTSYGIIGDNLPDDKLYRLFDSDKDAFHKANPWSSVKVNILRSRIFLASLKLHEYAILASAKPIRNNLSLFMEMLDGKVQVSAPVTAGLWQTFFFCVPVVSTSLASVSRLFNQMPRESIGWLLLDEAGQATPQSAAGAIFRSKRSIIIGDPLQIEPVVTIPDKLAGILNIPYQIEPEFSPLKTSAQILADRNTNLGTWMDRGDDDKIWAGLPLRTHRRCNNPMFEIANKIAYNGQMVKADVDVSFDSPLGESTWFDVEGVKVEDRQVVLEEIQILVSKIKLLKGINQDIFVISPFKSVAGRCRQALQYTHPQVKCGTIHTFQGKEADIVFLVLGSSPERPASRQWASQKPNMLNVALTRAKRRFYVIGNKKLWGKCQYFDTLALGLSSAIR